MSVPNGTVSGPAQSGAGSASHRVQELKRRVHRELLEHLDLGMLASLDSTQAEEHIRSALQSLVQSGSAELSGSEHQKLIEEIGCEIFGLGPLEAFLRDGDVSD